MYPSLNRRINHLANARSLADTLRIRRGIEKESLRITENGRLAQTAHPVTLGSALTHPRITTDFSEALLEFITPPYPSIDGALNDLDQTHRFTYEQLEHELLWVTSMPCLLESEDQIPVAQYGSSHPARMKTIYRIGLGYRYGRLMQTIAGIHFNYSLHADFWPFWQDMEQERQSLQETKNDAYFALIRNFHRLAWLLVYLFGASPALCRSFVGHRKHSLQPLTRGTLHLPWATSLRMGDLGYQSKAQSGLDISYNCLEEYVEALSRATMVPHPPYQHIGVKVAGEYRQLSASLLQIENEYYSAIRPKRTTRSGEAPRRALNERGVEYIEVRSLDLDPYLPLGICDETTAFVEIFLTFCLLLDSPRSSATERRSSRQNLLSVVNRGREPGLQLVKADGHPIALQSWADELLRTMAPIAELLDRSTGDNRYSTSLRRQGDKVRAQDLTPSARILSELTEQDTPFFEFAMALAVQHQQYFKSRPLDDRQRAAYVEASRSSLAAQAAIEATNASTSFDDYLASYFSQ